MFLKKYNYNYITLLIFYLFTVFGAGYASELEYETGKAAAYAAAFRESYRGTTSAAAYFKTVLARERCWWEEKASRLLAGQMAESESLSAARTRWENAFLKEIAAEKAVLAAEELNFNNKFQSDFSKIKILQGDDPQNDIRLWQRKADLKYEKEAERIYERLKACRRAGYQQLSSRFPGNQAAIAAVLDQRYRQAAREQLNYLQADMVSAYNAYTYQRLYDDHSLRYNTEKKRAANIVQKTLSRARQKGDKFLERTADLQMSETNTQAALDHMEKELSAILEQGLTLWHDAEKELLKARYQWEQQAYADLDRGEKVWRSGYRELVEAGKKWLSDLEGEFRQLKQEQSELMQDMQSNQAMAAQKLTALHSSQAMAYNDHLQDMERLLESAGRTCSTARENITFFRERILKKLKNKLKPCGDKAARQTALLQEDIHPSTNIHLAAVRLSFNRYIQDFYQWSSNLTNDYSAVSNYNLELRAYLNFCSNSGFAGRFNRFKNRYDSFNYYALIKSNLDNCSGFSHTDWEDAYREFISNTAGVFIRELEQERDALTNTLTSIINWLSNNCSPVFQHETYYWKKIRQGLSTNNFTAGLPPLFTPQPGDYDISYYFREMLGWQRERQQIRESLSGFMAAVRENQAAGADGFFNRTNEQRLFTESGTALNRAQAAYAQASNEYELTAAVYSYATNFSAGRETLAMTREKLTKAAAELSRAEKSYQDLNFYLENEVEAILAAARSNTRAANASVQQTAASYQAALQDFEQIREVYEAVSANQSALVYRQQAAAGLRSTVSNMQDYIEDLQNYYTDMEEYTAVSAALPYFHKLRETLAALENRKQAVSGLAEQKDLSLEQTALWISSHRSLLYSNNNPYAAAVSGLAHSDISNNYQNTLALVSNL
ncbi:MAG TPA: hypothetical protein VKS21_13810, partial [Spirochaetota bacterium]|nr:hypothetical protein [Spirochaetota bacterium]